MSSFYEILLIQEMHVVFPKSCSLLRQMTYKNTSAAEGHIDYFATFWGKIYYQIRVPYNVHVPLMRSPINIVSPCATCLSRVFKNSGGSLPKTGIL